MTFESVRVRFAPSPTGFFHVGSARTALYNWLFARHHQGKFIVRIEDTDRTRYHPGAVSDLLGGLRWLGLCWDEGPELGGEHGPYYQSDRLELYRRYAERLVVDGLAYPCYCSPARLAAMRQQQRAAGLPLGYDRRCRHLTRKQIADYEAQGIKPVIRLAIPTEGVTEYADHLRGHIVVENRQLDDQVILKSNGFPTYHLAVVVDDHLMGITHILRGDEWLSSVPKRVLLYRAFGWAMPVLAHLPTILDPSGKGKLSKRKKKLPGGRQALTYIHEFRQAGYLPEALVNSLALVGWSYDGQTEFFSRDELVRYFDLNKVSKSPGAFSYDKLDHMNAVYIRKLGANDLAGRLLEVLLRAGMAADFPTVLNLVPLVRERIKTLGDALPLADFFFNEDVVYDAVMLIQKKMDQEHTLAALHAAEEALRTLPSFDQDTLEKSLRALADRLGLKVGQLLGCIRVACTGKKVSPPLFGTLSILGQEVTVRRLHQAISLLSSWSQ